MIGILGSVLEWASLSADATPSGFLDTQATNPQCSTKNACHPGFQLTTYSENSKIADLTEIKIIAPDYGDYFSQHDHDETEPVTRLVRGGSPHTGQHLP